MILWLALRRLLVTLAVVSLVLAPATASAVPVGDAALMTAMANPAVDAMAAMDDMPCCPPAEPVMPDCQKGCPLPALCVVKVPAVLAGAVGVPRREAIPSHMVWGSDAMFSSVALRPLPEPPRS